MDNFFDFCADLEKTKDKLDGVLKLLCLVDMSASACTEKAFFGLTSMLEVIVEELEHEAHLAYSYSKKIKEQEGKHAA